MEREDPGFLVNRTVMQPVTHSEGQSHLLSLNFHLSADKHTFHDLTCLYCQFQQCCHPKELFVQTFKYFVES
jgi:hypothetical protein